MGLYMQQTNNVSESTSHDQVKRKRLLIGLITLFNNSKRPVAHFQCSGLHISFTQQRLIEVYITFTMC